jgi:hypothetical protein
MTAQALADSSYVRGFRSRIMKSATSLDHLRGRLDGWGLRGHRGL